MSWGRCELKRTANTQFAKSNNAANRISFHWEKVSLNQPALTNTLHLMCCLWRWRKCFADKPFHLKSLIFLQHFTWEMLQLKHKNFTIQSVLHKKHKKYKQGHIRGKLIFIFSRLFPSSSSQTWASAGWQSQLGKLLEKCCSSLFTDGQEGLSNWHSSMLMLHSRSIGR